MRVLMVFWHPEQASFNAAMLRTAKKTLRDQGHSVHVSDLGAMSFNPVSGRHNFTTSANPEYFNQQIEEDYAFRHQGIAEELEAERQKLEWCDLLIFQFPLWWCAMPATMKGWVDRVLGCQRSQDAEAIYCNGRFQHKKAMLSLTTGDPESMYQPEGTHGDIAAVLKPMQRGILAFTGFQVLEPFIAYQPAQLSEQARIDLLDDYTRRLRQIEHETAIDISPFKD